MKTYFCPFRLYILDLVHSWCFLQLITLIQGQVLDYRLYQKGKKRKNKLFRGIKNGSPPPPKKTQNSLILNFVGFSLGTLKFDGDNGIILKI